MEKDQDASKYVWVRHGKWDMNLDYTLGPSHFSEGEDGGWRLGCLGISKRGLSKEVERVDKEVEPEDRGAVGGGP